MKKFVIQIIFLCIVILGGFAIVSNPNLVNQIIDKISSPLGSATNTPITARKAQIGNSIINLEVADTPEKRTLGLGGRDSLDPNSGMLFTYPKLDKYRFWMKGMRIPLDFVWIKEDRVVQLMSNLPAPEANQADSTLPIYAPDQQVDKMIEVNAGFIQSHGIQVGDQVQLMN